MNRIFGVFAVKLLISVSPLEQEAIAKATKIIGNKKLNFIMMSLLRFYCGVPL
jgi:hypothetical protein